MVKKADEKDDIKDTDDDFVDISYDTISLEALGTHLFFGEVNEERSHKASEFLIKSNLFYNYESANPLTMVFNTPGGDCSEGFAVIDLMEISRIPVATLGIGEIASMGVLLLSAGYPGMRSITKNTQIMAHQFDAIVSGKHHELVATTKAFEHLEKRFINHFLRHSKMTEKQIRSVLFAPTDRYLTPEECLSYGLVDRIVEAVNLPKPKRAMRPSVPRSKK